MGASDYMENAFLDFVMGNSTLTPPTIYLGLSTTDPLDDGSGIAEPEGGSYERIAMDSWELASERRSQNDSEGIFSTATGSWGTLTHFFLSDALTDGNMLFHGQLLQSRVVISGNTVSLKTGDIDIKVNTGGLSNYLANALLDHILGNVVYFPPDHIYVGLSTEELEDASSGSSIAEPSGGSYARQEQANWDAAENGATANSDAITFPEATGNWGEILSVGLLDALTVGNMLLYGNLLDENGDETSADVNTTDTISFDIGDLILSLD